MKKEHTAIDPIDMRKKLVALVHQDYRTFQSRLMPGVKDYLGVPLLQLRKLSKEVVDQGLGIEYLAMEPGGCFEHIVLRGFVIGKMDLSLDERICYIESHLPHLNTWASCDAFCHSLHIKEEELARFYRYLLTLFERDRAYDVRFACVMGLLRYAKDPYLTPLCERFIQMRHPHKAVLMAAAWGVATFYEKNKKAVLDACHQNKITKDIYVLSKRKIHDARRILPEDKEAFKQVDPRG